jgi:hypothetical protein
MFALYIFVNIKNEHTMYMLKGHFRSFLSLSTPSTDHKIKIFEQEHFCCKKIDGGTYRTRSVACICFLS